MSSNGSSRGSSSDSSETDESSQDVGRPTKSKPSETCNDSSLSTAKDELEDKNEKNGEVNASLDCDAEKESRENLPRHTNRSSGEDLSKVPKAKQNDSEDAKTSRDARGRSSSSSPKRSRKRNSNSHSPASQEERNYLNDKKRKHRGSKREHSKYKRRHRSKSSSRDDLKSKDQPSKNDSAKSKSSIRTKDQNKQMLTTKTGGAYIPPAKLRLMQEQITDKSSEQFQRLAWEALKKSINGLINKVNSPNIGIIVRELFAENIVRGRGLLCLSIMQVRETNGFGITNDSLTLLVVISPPLLKH